MLYTFKYNCAAPWRLSISFVLLHFCSYFLNLRVENLWNFDARLHRRDREPLSKNEALKWCLSPWPLLFLHVIPLSDLGQAGIRVKSPVDFFLYWRPEWKAKLEQKLFFAWCHPSAFARSCIDSTVSQSMIPEWSVSICISASNILFSPL